MWVWGETLTDELELLLCAFVQSGEMCPCPLTQAALCQEPWLEEQRRGWAYSSCPFFAGPLVWKPPAISPGLDSSKAQQN